MITIGQTFTLRGNGTWRVRSVNWHKFDPEPRVTCVGVDQPGHLSLPMVEVERMIREFGND